MKKYTYTLENLNCAHCASKIESKIANTQGFENVSFNFATKILSFSSENPESLLQIQQICDSIEDGVTVVDSSKKPKEKQSEKINSDTVMLIIAIVLGVAAFVLHLVLPENQTYSTVILFALSAAATLLSGYKIFLKGIKNAVRLKIDETVLLAVAVVAAFCLGEFVEAAMVTILFSLGEFIEDIAVDASRRDIEKLAQIRPDTATIVKDGVETVVPAESVKTGSIITVKPYERLPLDGVVTKGKSTLDTSALTGESLPVDISVGSEVMSGAINGNGLIEIRTTKEYGNSTASRILQLVEEASARKGQKEKLITRFASIYTPIVIIIAAAIAFIPPLLGLGELSEWIYRALVCLVASCPCAIVISVPLSYYSGIGAASKIGVLIKGGKYIEALAKADSFVFDKTGTLTSGKLEVESITTFGGYDKSEVIALAAACEKHSVHHVATAIKKKAEGLDLPQLSDYSESAGHGTSAVYNGKKLECGGIKILSDEQKKLAGNASVFVVYDGELIGALSVSDSVRAESQQVISKLKKLGIKNTVMLTGDSKGNAEKVSEKLGLDKCYSNLLPNDKLDRVEEIKTHSKAVCFVGDGINDAPVLSASDCGIAMGLGSEAAIEASDAVLSSGNLVKLPDAIKLSRRVMRTVKTNIAFALTVKAAVIILAAFGLASMWMSVIADTGVSVACVLYAARLLKSK
ncbi:heavy metal translocating P-type ATPase [Ruminococcus sp.]|uniref:heavy metal translocating P-type ATPase n=1 Tax=Ruminococcus sp. TaxID=41978 RepID=UPI00261C7C6E|nr:heavy metal translocating P-type ATPase [Ruminococcus sp.]MDD6988580.1 heavy metal translocating P-type ATPase [Ruminococcus sp.]MDY6201385.1 heavy metal translocating P-type ATPase [Ruminococcus sp.]